MENSMSDQTHTLAQYHAAITSAIRAEDIKAIPGLLVMMASDGYGHEAEVLRRDMLTVIATEAVA